MTDKTESGTAVWLLALVVVGLMAMMAPDMVKGLWYLVGGK